MSLPPVRSARTVIAGACATVASAAMAMMIGVPASAAATPATIQYAALGDSYAAGFGAGQPSGPGNCARTGDAYPALWSQSVPGAVTLAHVACTGATTTDVVNNQLGAVTADTDLVTLTIGVNDLNHLGGGNMLNNCTNPAQIATCETLIQNALATELPNAVGPLLAQLKARAPRAMIAVVGYPRLFDTSGACPAFDPPALPVGTARTFVNNVIVGINTVLAAAANTAGVRFVTVTDAFAGHEVCTADPWLGDMINGVPLHPTATGQQAGYLAALSSQVGTVAQVNAWMVARDAAAATGASSAAAQSQGTLPVTGARVAGMVGLGLAVLAAGAVLLLLTRRRRLRLTVD